jgi:hypothetical protein
MHSYNTHCAPFALVFASLFFASGGGGGVLHSQDRGYDDRRGGYDDRRDDRGRDRDYDRRY